jgi:hypothetical protein
VWSLERQHRLKIAEGGGRGSALGVPEPPLHGVVKIVVRGVVKIVVPPDA